MFLLIALSLTVAAEDWPQFRGPNRDAISHVNVPVWPEKLAAKWQVDVGEGHASPVFGGGRLYVFARQNETEVVRAIDPASGKQLWQQSYAAPYDMNSAATAHGKGPKSTPLYAEGRLYTFGINGMLACWDAATGKRIWRHDFKTTPTFGGAMSPVLHNGMLIAHGGATNLGALMAFNAATGNVQWLWKGDGPAYSSPVIAQVAGGAQLITFSEKYLIAINPANGQLLWKTPFTTPYDQNAVTPVVRGDVLIYSGLDAGVTAVKLTAQGPQQTLWQNKTVSMYMNSPVWNEGLVCGLSHKNKGQYFCLNAANGQVTWTSAGRQGDNAAMILLGKNLIALDTDARLHVFNGTQEVRKYETAKSATWAHPAIIPGGLVIKDVQTLYFYPL